MSNSSLVSYVALSPNNSGRRTEEITKITPHHMSGNLSVETCGSVFAPSSRQASSNYGIGSDGRVGMYVEEGNRAWTSSSRWNDQRAVTIEVANSYCGGDWPISDEAWNTLVNLCVDICKRNSGIKRADGRPGLHYTGDKYGSLTKHKMFADTDCPGTWLDNHMVELADAVNAILDGNQAPAPTPAAPAPVEHGPATQRFSGTYRCTVNTLNIRNAPNLSGDVVGQYHKGGTVNLDDWYKIADGYVWGRYTAYSGNVRYIAVGKATGKPEPDDYLIKI